MERKPPHLCKPIRTGNVLYRNRMFSAHMGGTDIELDGCIAPKSQAFCEYRAKGGCAAVTASELMVHPSDGSLAYRLDEIILNSLPKATYTADAIRRHLRPRSSSPLECCRGALRLRARCISACKAQSPILRAPF